MAAKDRRFGDLVARAPSNAATRHPKQARRKPSKKRERERERFAGGGEETRPGAPTGGDQISALPQERSRAVSYTSGFQGCFLIACGVRAGWPGLSYWLLRPTRGRSTDRSWYHSKTAVMVLLLGPVPEHNRCSPIVDVAIIGGTPVKLETGISSLWTVLSLKGQ
jgi:hypothetical protein